MRAATRLLASIKSARFLEAGNPTGLTGLLTHAAPRSTLLFLYEVTLDRLQSFPEHSVYRKSTEAITKQRHGVVSSVKAAGYDEWSQRILEMIQKHPNAFSGNYNSPYRLTNVGNSAFVMVEQKPEDELLMEWDGENPDGVSRKYNSSHRVARVGNRVALTVEQKPEDKRPMERDRKKVTERERKGPPTAEELAKFQRMAEEWVKNRKPQESSKLDLDAPKWEPEPPLEASQIVEIENRIGAGLIEEVIEVAEGELKLVQTMLESKAWEELEEKAPEGQWEYFARDQHTRGTQQPTSK